MLRVIRGFNTYCLAYLVAVGQLDGQMKVRFSPGEVAPAQDFLGLPDQRRRVGFMGMPMQSIFTVPSLNV